MNAPDISTLLLALSNDDESVRDSAQRQLRQVFSEYPRSADQAASLAGNLDSDGAARLLFAMEGTLGESEVAREFAIAALSSPQERVREGAARGLWTTVQLAGTQKALLQALSTEKVDGVSRAIIYTLRRVAAVPEVRTRLDTISLDNKRPAIQRAAIEAMFDREVLRQLVAAQPSPMDLGDPGVEQPADEVPRYPTPVADIVGRAERAATEIRGLVAEIRDLDSTRLGQAALDMILEIVDDTFVFVERHADDSGDAIESDAVPEWRTRASILRQAARILSGVNEARHLAEAIFAFISGISGGEASTA